MNRHEFADRASVSVAALLSRDTRFFGRSLDSDPIDHVVRETDASVGELRPGEVQQVAAAGPAGEFDASYLVYRWQGPDAPTLVYHHGSGERPYDFGRFSSNSFYRIFGGIVSLDVNLIALRAPFHEGSQREYLEAMGELENFVGMLATSTKVLASLSDRLQKEGCPVVVAAGYSLGGWVVNLHRAYYGTVDRYVPMAAGAQPDQLFVSSIYRKLAAERARKNPAVLEEVLDFEADFVAVDSDDCDPLLARYDRIVEFETQRHCYEGMDLDVLEKGHITAALATEDLREHVLHGVPREIAAHGDDTNLHR